jgi:hypothetical protein
LQRVADPTRDVYQRADHELNDGGSDVLGEACERSLGGGRDD